MIIKLANELNPEQTLALLAEHGDPPKRFGGLRDAVRLNQLTDRLVDLPDYEGDSSEEESLRRLKMLAEHRQNHFDRAMLYAVPGVAATTGSIAVGGLYNAGKISGKNALIGAGIGSAITIPSVLGNWKNRHSAHKDAIEISNILRGANDDY